VPYAHAADYILCVARTSNEKDEKKGITVFIVPAKASGIKYKLLKTIAGDKLCEVTFEMLSSRRITYWAGWGRLADRGENDGVRSGGGLLRHGGRPPKSAGNDSGLHQRTETIR